MSDTLRIGVAIDSNDPYWVQVREAAHTRAQELPRVSTDDLWGDIVAYVGEGELTSDPLETFGGYGVIRIPNLQGLLQHSCENGFEHHVAVSLSQVASAVSEALGKYMGWEVYFRGE